MSSRRHRSEGVQKLDKMQFIEDSCGSLGSHRRRRGHEVGRESGPGRFVIGELVRLVRRNSPFSGPRTSRGVHAAAGSNYSTSGAPDGPSPVASRSAQSPHIAVRASARLNRSERQLIVFPWRLRADKPNVRSWQPPPNSWRAVWLWFTHQYLIASRSLVTHIGSADRASHVWLHANVAVIQSPSQCQQMALVVVLAVR
jgi:hypothetical protein